MLDTPSEEMARATEGGWPQASPASELFVELDLRGGIDSLKKTSFVAYNGVDMDGSGARVGNGARPCGL